VAIARALAMRPKVLLLDEITSALDPELVGEVEDVIRSLLSDRIIMVLVTHALGFAREVAHRIAYLEDGAIVELGSPADILDQPKDPSLKEFLRRALILTGRESAHGRAFRLPERRLRPRAGREGSRCSIVASAGATPSTTTRTFERAPVQAAGARRALLPLAALLATRA
jgi:ABC-type sulfate/molybdate transport systems ATPase subunit